MYGAIVGDVVGSYYEHFPTKQTDFDLFREDSSVTDDSVLTIAVADWIMHRTKRRGLAHFFHDYVKRYPQAGYGGTFIKWARAREFESYGSWGNGSAMRVSPVAYAVDTLKEVLELAAETANVTHSHEEGVRGAKATAGAVFLARTGASKSDIRNFAVESGYDLSKSLAEIRPEYGFDVSCAGSVPQSIVAFLESESYEDAIRLAISLGGDADTMACIAGSIAEPFFGGVPANLVEKAKTYLDEESLAIVSDFYDTVVGHSPFDW